MEKQSLSAKGIRHEAHGLLSNNWSRALGALCVSLMSVMVFVLLNQFVNSLVYSVINIDDASQSNKPGTIIEYINYYNSQEMRVGLYVTLVMAAFYFLIVSPLNLGVTNWYQSLAICGDLKVGQIFYYYRTNELFVSALTFEFARLIRHICVLAASLLPASVCIGLAVSYSDASASEDQRRMAIPLSVAGAALIVVGLIVYAVIVLRWFAAKYLFVGGHGYGVQDCFNYSRKYMKGKIGSVLGIFFSCIPAWILCVLIFPVLYVVPFCKAVFACTAQDIIDDAA